jgi:transcription elongation factor Elf1
VSLYVDIKFVSLISPKLERFSRKGEYLWNFRCLICGDSQKNKLKARGYIYRQKSNLFFSCHNCGTSMIFGKFLKTIDKSLYNEYQLECYGEGKSNVKKPDFSEYKTKTIFNKKVKINLPSIVELPENHSAKVFLGKRKIPEDRLSQLFYANDFFIFVKELLPEYDRKLYTKDPRIVIPFYDENKNLLGFQGRALVPSSVKYITIKMDEANKKVYGLDRLDKSKTVYVVEGPIDSLFLPNAIAAMDASLFNIIREVGDLDYVFVYDNESRNKDVCRNIEKTISLGKKVVIWPSNIKEKDINDMVLAGLDVQSIIDSNTFEGLQAKLNFIQWKKI